MAEHPDEAAGAVEIEVSDVLDLHSFLPREVPDLVRDYLDLAWQAGLHQLRIIHGKGAGVQRRTIRALCRRDDRVERVEDAPLEAGSWGASCVVFRPRG